MEKNTWREMEISINPHELKDINFVDTTPNIFYFTNFSNVELHGGISSIPSIDKKEFVIRQNNTTVFGKPNNCSRLMIFNPSSSETVVIKICSCNDKFDITMLNSPNVELSDFVADKIKGDGVIRGFTSPLPRGGNEIGIVSLNQAQLDSLNSCILMEKNVSINQKQLDSLNNAILLEKKVSINNADLEIIVNAIKENTISSVSNLLLNSILKNNFYNYTYNLKQNTEKLDTDMIAYNSYVYWLDKNFCHVLEVLEPHNLSIQFEPKKPTSIPKFLVHDNFFVFVPSDETYAISVQSFSSTNKSRLYKYRKDVFI